MRMMEKRGGWVPALALLWGVLWGSGMQSAWADPELQWAWMKGASAISQPGVYASSPPAANTPGARQKAASWTDSSGTPWLFGGLGFDYAGSRGDLNDLWKYDRSTGNWTWMKGANTVNQSGTYGVSGTPAAANVPGARYQALSWTDLSGALWLFGGYGYDSAGTVEGHLNDLWKYSPTTGNWAWIKGPLTIEQSGTYGTLGKPAAANCPGARGYAVTWTGPSGALWLFGGLGYDGAGNMHRLNDLWRFDQSTGNWTWMKGASTIDQSGVYGTLGTPAAANTPGARFDAASWTDPSGALWLFGGYGYDAAGSAGYLNDLWKFDTATGNWAWMKGDSVVNQTGIYGVPGTAAPTNTPGARTGAIPWTDPSGALWLMGGYFLYDLYTSGSFNDLWKYSPSSGSWAWIKGAQAIKQSGVYGTRGTSSADNLPGSRYRAASWADGTGALWLLGGSGCDAAGNSGDLNDLWRIITPDVLAPTGSIVINNSQSVTNNPNVTLSLTWSDGIGSGVVRMKFSNDGATWTAWEPLAATKAWSLPAGEGYKTVRAQYRDAAGINSVVYSDYIRVDTIPPTGTIIINGGDTSTKKRVVSLGLTWSDGTAGSGVTRMRFSMDGATWSAWEPQMTPKSYTLPSTPGHYTVRVTYRDAGGNISDRYSDYIRLDAP